MTTRYHRPVDLHTEWEGGFSVTSPNFAEAFTDGDTFVEAVTEAADCLEEALASRIMRNDDTPMPNAAEGCPTAAPGAILAMKAALYEALCEEEVQRGPPLCVGAISCGYPDAGSRERGGAVAWPYENRRPSRGGHLSGFSLPRE